MFDDLLAYDGWVLPGHYYETEESLSWLTCLPQPRSGSSCYDLKADALMIVPNAVNQ